MEKNLVSEILHVKNIKSSREIFPKRLHAKPYFSISGKDLIQHTVMWELQLKIQFKFSHDCMFNQQVQYTFNVFWCIVA